MKLLDYIQGLRKGKEAHRLEKESMKDPFLADAMDGYGLVEGDHEQQIRKLQMKITTRSAKKKNTYAISWSIAACLILGIGISSYFLFLKKDIVDDVIIAKESIPTTASAPMAPKEKNPSLIAKKTDADSMNATSESSTYNKDIIAKAKQAKKTQLKSAPVAITPVIEESAIPVEIQEDEAVVRAVDTFDKEKINKQNAQTINMLRGLVTDMKGNPLAGATVSYKGTNIKTITNPKGEFSIIKKKYGEKLTTTYAGYHPVEIPIDTNQTILIALNDYPDTIQSPIVPEPVVGMKKYKKYLKEKLIQPKDEACAAEKGKVVLTFLVDRKGRPFNIRVKQSLCESSDKEAIRLVQEGPDWTYGNQVVEITVKFQ